MSNVNRLNKLKEKYDALKEEALILKGKLEVATKDLKDLGFSDVKEAQISLEKLKTDIEKRETKINDSLDEIEEKYDWSN